MFAKSGAWKTFTLLVPECFRKVLKITWHLLLCLHLTGIGFWNQLWKEPYWEVNYLPKNLYLFFFFFRYCLDDYTVQKTGRLHVQLCYSKMFTLLYFHQVMVMNITNWVLLQAKQLIVLAHNKWHTSSESN